MLGLLYVALRAPKNLNGRSHLRKHWTWTMPSPPGQAALGSFGSRTKPSREMFASL